MGRIRLLFVAVLVLLFLAGTCAAASLSNSGGGIWKYQRDISIKENSGTALTDYQVLIELKGADFPVETKSDGTDIRFTDSNGNELNYWIENWDYAGKRAKVWVKVPSIPADSITVIQIYYGNPSAGVMSEGDEVFEFFDDFDTNTLSNYDVNLNTVVSPDWKTPVNPTYDSTNKRVNINNGDNIETTISPKNIDFLDVYAEAIFHMDGAYPAGAGGKISIRWQDSNNWYQAGKDGAGYSKTGGRGTACDYGSPFLSKIIGRNAASLAEPISNSYINLGTEQKIGLGIAGNTLKLFINDDLVLQTTDGSITSSGRIIFSGSQYRGWIDNIRVRKYASSEPTVTLSPPKSSSLSITKSASPYSIRLNQEATITISLENSGTTDITDIEVKDSIHPSFDRVSGDLPDTKRFDLIGFGESREIEYKIRAKESGTFNLDPATVTYADGDGNIQEGTSEPVSIKVIIKSDDGDHPANPSSVSSASVNLHGEKTDVELGEDVLLKLSAVNIIGNPVMHVQVIIIPPSGWSVTSSEFAKSGAGQYTTTYELESGGGKDIEVRIVPNQIGDEFQVEGRIIYYFGDDVSTREDHTLSLPIKVRAKSDDAPITINQPDVGPKDNPEESPGFGLIFAVGAVVLIWYIRIRK